MSSTNNISVIATIISSVADILKGNPDNKAFRLSKRKRRWARKELNRAQKELESLKNKISKDSDGYSDDDKKLIKELEQHLIDQTVALIKM